MTDLEKKMAAALEICHVLLTAQRDDLLEKKLRCRSPERYLAIDNKMRAVQVARTAANEALKAIIPVG